MLKHSRLSNEQKPDGFVATWRGVVQNGIYAIRINELTLVVHELLEEEAAFDCMAERNGWRIRPVKLVFLDEPAE